MCIRDNVYQIIEEINRRFIIEVQNRYPGNYEKIKKMAIIYDGQVKIDVYKRQDAADQWNLLQRYRAVQRYL